MDATVGVVRQAIELGANLILVHEPTNYTSSDEPGWQEDFKNDVYAEKAKLMAEHRIAVWRDHDHMHAHQPDGIFTGVLKFLGWEEYSVTDSSMGMYTHFIVTPPTEKQTTLQALLRQLKETVGINGVCVLRDADKVAMVVKHLYALPERS